MENQEQKIINFTDKPHSYEFGKPTNRFKLFFNEPKDLKEMIKNLKDLGILTEDNSPSEEKK